MSGFLWMQCGDPVCSQTLASLLEKQLRKDPDLGPWSQRRSIYLAQLLYVVSMRGICRSPTCPLFEDEIVVGVIVFPLWYYLGNVGICASFGAFVANEVRKCGK